MARKKKTESETAGASQSNVMGLHAEVVEQPITETLEVNFMPYAMSVIMSRAIPEIDGFKPSHRKLLYTMYKMGLLSGARTKSANIVGATMKLNPHGDAAIYDTMVRLSRGHEALLTPFVDSKGNFGKHYSRDMAWAAPRYTEARLAPICAELFRDIDKDTVDMADNYDGSMKEPTLLPCSFPNVLVSANLGIAVGMASQICGFNLGEVCQTAIARLQDPASELLSTLPAPDFPTGGEILYDPAEMREIYRTGRGSFRVRARWRYLEKENMIEVYEIPYSTTAEQIMDKVAELMKAGRVREISDMRDETDLRGLKLTIDLKRGTDPDKLMAKLCKLTPLTDPFSCNFNVLIAGSPRVLGVGEILDEWIAWRTDCVRRRIYYDLGRKREKLHLLRGLGAILLDIDKAIRIIRETEREAEVVPNLMAGFGIDELQANFVAEIKLRNINREYILRRVEETEALEREIAALEATLESRRKVRAILIAELRDVSKKYAEPRRTGLVQVHEVETWSGEDEAEDYPVTLFLSREGYFKKITAASLRMNDQQKFKENDGLRRSFESSNRAEMLVFTDRQQCYKCRVSDFADSKASALGDYLPGKLGFDEGERVVDLVLPGDYSAQLLLVYENGKVGRVPLAGYATKTKRRRLTGASSDKSPLVCALRLDGEGEIALFTSEGRCLIFDSALLQPKTSRSTQGVAVARMKPKYCVTDAMSADLAELKNLPRYRVRTLPALGALLRSEDRGLEQLKLDDI